MASGEYQRFKITQPVPVATTARKSSKDFHYWRGLQFPITIKEFGAVTNVHFQPTWPNLFAVTASTRVELYDPETSEVVKTFSRFHDVAYGASFRSDGKLLIAGNEDSHLRLFDVEGRVPLRVFKGHRRPVHVSKFCNNLQHIFSASDDKSVKIWDVATEKTLHEYNQHQDYIRCGSTIQTTENIILTGSYDHTVRMFDTRTDESTMCVDHGSPVESVLMFPSGTILLSAGGNVIKVWDVLQGGKLLATVSHHHKTITCMCFNHDYTRILSGSLDRHVKIYDVASYSVVHNIDYPGSILSMDISQDDKTLVVGMADKMLSIRHRKHAVTSEQDETEEKYRKKRRQRSLFMEEKTFVPNEGDVVIRHKQRDQLNKYDHYFQKFQHTKALDAALLAHVQSNTPEVTVAVLEELIRRNTIKAALSGRSEKKLIILLKFLSRNVSNISFAPVLLEVTELVVDIYSETMEDMPTSIRPLFYRLRALIRMEKKLHIEMYKLMGSMDAIISSNAQTINFLKQQRNNDISISTKDAEKPTLVS